MFDQSTAEPKHFSAEVYIELRIENQSFEVWSIGPNEIILREGHDIAPGNAEVAVFIDSKEYCWPVRLPNGAVPFDTEVFMMPRGPMVLTSKDGEAPGRTAVLH